MFSAEIVSPSERSGGDCQSQRSWPFRLANLARSIVAAILGMTSLIFLLGVLSSIPVLNLMAFGYLLEVTRRTAQHQPIQQILVGHYKGRYLGGILLGAWLILLPIRYLSHLAFEAQLVDPAGGASSQIYFLRSVLVILLVAHVAAALICGGRLRYFFWPFVAPFSILIWSIRRLAGQNWFRLSIKFLTEWISPGLAEDFCRVAPIKDWFLPAIFFNKMSQPDFVSHAGRAVWNFVRELRLFHYFQFGFSGFVGTLSWLALPTLLLAGATLNQESAVAVPAALLGAIFAIPVFSLLPILQAHFAVNRKLSSFWQLREAIRVFRLSPIWHLLAWLSIVLLSLPLFLLKIETVPAELLWTLSIVFWIFSLPARVISGFAYGRSQKAERVRPWWLTIPTAMLLVIVSTLYLLILTTTRYTSWNGAISLFENHIFLLPTPFWL